MAPPGGYHRKWLDSIGTVNKMGKRGNAVGGVEGFEDNLHLFRQLFSIISTELTIQRISRRNVPF